MRADGVLCPSKGWSLHRPVTHRTDAGGGEAGETQRREPEGAGDRGPGLLLLRAEGSEAIEAMAARAGERRCEASIGGGRMNGL